jgi:hypothetical protein
MSRWATAGQARGTYCALVPSSRTAAWATITSPRRRPGCIAPQEPTRIRVWAPRLQSSSTAIAAEGPPIPVEVTLTTSP